MPVRNVENRLPQGVAASDFGQATSITTGPNGEQFVLVSYLTSPVTEQTKLDYVLFALPPVGSNLNLWLDYVDVDDYEWNVIEHATGSPIGFPKVTEVGRFDWNPLRTGGYTVRVKPRAGGTELATLQLTQQVKARDPRVETIAFDMALNQDPGTEIDALREIVNDFTGYINASASATGPNGIPVRFLAAVLFKEIWARPKEGTANAFSYRLRAGSKQNPTWVEWTEDEIRERLGRKVRGITGDTPPWAKREFGHVDDIRCVELELVADAIDDKWAGRRGFVGGKTIGAGQISPATAAMVLGNTPWVEQPPENKAEARDEVNGAWSTLPLWTQVNVFNTLRFPKTNIDLAAKLLAKLKNRTTRWPGMIAADLTKNRKAVEVLATEYGFGPTSTLLAAAKGHPAHARQAWAYVQSGSLLHPEKFFP